MKKLALFLLFLALCIAHCTATFAAGTHTCGAPVSVLPPYGTPNPALSTYTVTCNWTGDAITGSVPSAVITGTSPTDSPNLSGYYPYQIDISPGTPAPTGYSMTLTFLVGSTPQDLMGGNGTGISSTAGSWQLLTSGGKGFRRNIGPITGNVTNTVAGAQGAYTLSFIPQ
jgi:hypothetical protein